MLYGIGVGAGVELKFPHSIDCTVVHLPSRGWFLYLVVSLPFMNPDYFSCWPKCNYCYR